MADISVRFSRVITFFLDEIRHVFIKETGSNSYFETFFLHKFNCARLQTGKKQRKVVIK